MLQSRAREDSPRRDPESREGPPTSQKSTTAPHVLHIHGHHVRLLDALDDGWKPFWLDTILCVPQQTTRAAFVADNAGKWMLHARAVGAAGQTLTWFEVS